MLNQEMRDFFEGILARRSNEYRVSDEDLASVEALCGKQAAIRTRLKDLLKLDAIAAEAGMERYDSEGHVAKLPAPTIVVNERINCDGYVREHWMMEVMPGIHMPLYVLVPDGFNNNKKHTVVLAAHGHGPGKDGTIGNMPNPIFGQINRGSSYGEQMVKAGYMVYAPDMWGFGERRVLDRSQYGASDCTKLSDAAEACGFTLLGLFVWDHMRIIDYMMAQPYFGNVVMMGFSGGGEQTIFTTALDERIVCAYAGGYLHQFKGGMLYNHMCSCNFVPGLFRDMELSDVAGLIAPRPMLYENGFQDGLNGEGGICNVEEAADRIRKVYAVYGKENALVTNFWDGGHQYNGSKTLDFFSMNAQLG